MQSGTKQTVCPACKGAKQVERGGKKVICQHCRGTGKAAKLQTK